MDLTTISNHYDDPDFSAFYKDTLGLKGNHIGLYMANTHAENQNTTIEEMELGQTKKTDLLIFFIKNYLNISYHYIVSVDFGSGYGETIRRIYNEIKEIKRDNNNKYSECVLYSYDISSENCSTNNIINFKENVPIRLYNRDFTETLFEDGSVNLVLSEESFHQVQDKLKLICEIMRVLSKVNGYLIFSDIFLKENNTCEENSFVQKTLGLTAIQTFSEFRNLAEENHLKYCNAIYYSTDILLHYSNLLYIAKQNKLPDKIINYLKNWIECSKYLDVGIFVFKKGY